ncbi:hypothetical protein VH22019_00060 [Vibrio phage VH2_2019]|nr:hypothetical protein VH22019_00060 [Vibrio phage VH2_2019]
MEQVSKEVLEIIAESNSVENVSVAGVGRYPVSPNMAKKLLEVTEGDAEHVIYTSKVEFHQLVRSIVGTGSLLQNMRNY